MISKRTCECQILRTQILFVLVLCLSCCGQKKDTQTDLLQLRKDAESGIPEAQYNLGLRYDNGNGVEKNQKEALVWFHKAAENGLSEAQYNLAVFYSRGEVVPKNETEALNWCYKAAQQGDPDAQRLLGIFYFTAMGVNQNLVQSYKWFILAKANGCEEARDGISSCEEFLDPIERLEGQKLADEWQQDFDASRSH